MIRLISAGLVVSGLFVCLLVSGGASSQPVSTQPEAEDIARDLLDQSAPIIAPSRTTEPAREDLPRRDRWVRPPVIPPRGVQRSGKKLLPEGFYVVDRRGRLVRSGDQWMFAFESDGKALADPPMGLLRNEWLERVESEVATGAHGVIFRVSGEVTCYRGKNYLLLRKVLLEPKVGPAR